MFEIKLSNKRTHADLMITEIKESGDRYLFRPLDNNAGAQPELEFTPTLSLEQSAMNQFLQALVDEASRHGIVPQRLRDCGAVLAATESHLNDLQLLFGLKGERTSRMKLEVDQ